MDNEKKVQVIYTIIAGVSMGIFTLLNYFLYDRANKEMTNNQLKIENELRPLEFENNLKLALYKEVKESIEQKDTTLQNATLLIVNEMLDGDSIFREKLINILLQSTNSQKLIESQQKLDEFKIGQASIRPGVFTIDIFYLEDFIKEAEPRAEAIYSILRSKYPNYNIRKRLLPRSINAKLGYQIDFNQIRYDIGTKEELLAKDILNEVQRNGIFQREQPVLKGISNDTKNYLSLFIRNM